MQKINIKPTHKAVRNYYDALQQYDNYNIKHEGAVSNPFAILLDSCAKKMKATFVPQYIMRTPAGNRIVRESYCQRLQSRGGTAVYSGLNSACHYRESGDRKDYR